MNPWVCPKCGGSRATVHIPSIHAYEIAGTRMEDDVEEVIILHADRCKDEPASGDLFIVCQEEKCHYIRQVTGPIDWY